MLVFGHTGISLGAAVLLNRALTRNHSSARVNDLGEQSPPSAQMPTTHNFSTRYPVSWFTSLAKRIDIRLLLVGSLLPDIIDKPVGMFFFRDTFSNGRIFSHTLLFLILITVAGLYLWRSRHKTWLLVLSFGTFTHVILDGMWLSPRTFLWPLYGFSFEKMDISYWTWEMFYGLLTNPMVWIPELVGVGIVIWFVLLLVRKGNLYTFLRNGRLW